jgi:hypothetical protein
LTNTENNSDTQAALVIFHISGFGARLFDQFGQPRPASANETDQRSSFFLAAACVLPDTVPSETSVIRGSAVNTVCRNADTSNALHH